MSSECQAFRETSQIFKQLLENAQNEGRKYSWTPVGIDYWLPEKKDFNYEISCPYFFTYPDLQDIEKSTRRLEIYAVFEDYLGHENYLLPFALVWQIKGTTKPEEFVSFAKIYAYMRFSLRDYNREKDTQWWNDFFLENAVSNETILIMNEDKIAAQAWAQDTFPDNSHNAWVGKCGEFVFASWAGECGLPVSLVDLTPHPNGDEYDFLHHMLFGEELKIDIKAFQIQEGKNRDYWNVSVNCLEGEHKQDIIVFTVISEDFRMGKVVGYLPSNEIKKKGEYISNFNDLDYPTRGYYKIELKNILNPYYLRATLDIQNQIHNGYGFSGFSTAKVIDEMIQDYPLDPITAYRSGIEDLFAPHRGGKTNLFARPMLQMFVPLNFY